MLWFELANQRGMHIMSATKLLCSMLIAGLLPAAHPVRADDDSHRQAVLTLFRLTQMESKINDSVDELLAVQLQQNPELVPDRATVRDFLERTIGWDALRPALLAMYQATFSEEELAQMNAFYITPVGQKVLTRVPELVQERNRLAAQRLQDHIAELRQALGAEEADARH